MSNVTHRFEITHNIGKACEKAASRFAFGSVLATPAANGHDANESVFLCATDGRQASIVRETGTADRETMIPLNAIPKLAKRGAAYVELNGEFRNSDSKVAPAPSHDTGRFPNVDDVIPEMEQTAVCLKLDANILLKLAQAIGESGVIELLLPIGDNGHVDKAIGVLGDNRQSFGVFMPLGGDWNRPEEADKYRRDTIGHFNANRVAYKASRDKMKANGRDWNSQLKLMVEDHEKAMKAAQAGV